MGPFHQLNRIVLGTEHFFYSEQKTGPKPVPWMGFSLYTNYVGSLSEEMQITHVHNCYYKYCVATMETL